jgi:hypothetical protein
MARPPLVLGSVIWGQATRQCPPEYDVLFPLHKNRRVSLTIASVTHFGRMNAFM